MKRIRVLVFAGIFFLSLVGIFVARVAFHYRQEMDLFRHAVSDSALINATAMATTLDLHVQAGEWELIAEHFADLAQMRSDAHYWIVDPAGAILADSRASDPSGRLDFPVIYSAMQSRQPEVQSNGNDYSAIAAVPLDGSNGSMKGVLVFSANWETWYNQTRQRYFQNEAIYLAVILLIFAGVVYLTARYLLFPLNQLRRLALEIANGARDRRLSAFRLEELDEAARAINKMLDVEAAQRAEVAQLNRSLQEVVNQRTGQLSESEDSLRKREAILKAVNSAAEKFLTAATWENHIQDVLERLGHVIGCSRITIYENFRNQLGVVFVNNVYEWCAPGVHSYLGDPVRRGASLRALGFGRWKDLLSHGQVVKGLVREMPERDQMYLMAPDIRSMFAAPLFVDQDWWGGIIFVDTASERSWQVEEEALRLAASIIGGAITRTTMEQTIQGLYETERRQRELSQFFGEVGTLLNSKLDVDAVLDSLLDQIPHLVPYDMADVMMVKDGRVSVAHMRGYEGYSPAFIQQVANASFDLMATPNLHRMYKTGEPLIISDVASDPEWDHEHGSKLVRSWAGTPVISQGEVIAFFSLVKLQPNYYQPAHADMLRIFASQAALALRNAQLFGEQAEALEREKHLDEVTNTISSTLDLPTILQNVSVLAAELVGADASALAMISLDGESISYPYGFNLPEELKDLVQPRGTGLAWQVIESGAPQLLNDYSLTPNVLPECGKTGMCSAIYVPVTAGDERLGTLALFSHVPEKRFTPREVTLAESTARQTGVAIQNAHRFEAARRRAEEIETLRQAAAAISSALEFDEVMEHILSQLEKVVPFDSTAVFLQEGAYLRLIAGKGFPGDIDFAGRLFPADDALFMEISRRSCALVISDTQADKRFCSWLGTTYICGWMGVPLLVHGHPIGYLTLDSRTPGAYDHVNKDLVQAFANAAAVAIENARLFQQVQQYAITDPLTGLYNRRYFNQVARRELDRARRYNAPLSVIMIDVDYFKQVNDTYGHLVGDRVLVNLAQRCRETVRDVDVLARFGGEEFVILLPETSLEGAKLVADRLRENVNSRSFDAGSSQVSVTISLGVASLDLDCIDYETLVRRADQALYFIKGTGRGHVAEWKSE